MKDFVENMESAAESAYVDMLQPNGQMKCSCGKLFNEDMGEVLSPNPYGMPSCPHCADEFFDAV